jgi:hypothetical protein
MFRLSRKLKPSWPSCTSLCNAQKIADQQDAQQKLGINRRSPYLAVALLNLSRTKEKLMCFSMRRSRWDSGT